MTLLAASGALWFASRPVAAVAAAFAGLSWAGVIWSIERVIDADALVGAGMILAPLLPPLLVVVVVGLPALWRIPDRLTPALVAASIVIAVTGVLRVLVYEPILDLHCGLFCGHSPVVVVSNAGLAAWLGTVSLLTTAIVCGTVALGILSARWGQAGGGPRDVLPRVLAASAMVVLAATALGSTVSSSVGATSEELVSLVAIKAVACVAMAGAAIIVAADRLVIGRNLAQIARLMTADSNRPSAEALLRDAVGDPGLSVGYWTDDRGYVTSDGRPLDLTAQGRQRTELTSRGAPIAIVLHDHALPSDLVEAHIGPEARLAIQNESLELELERRLEQLRASRRRVVEAGDAARRQLERDLHDGAQQLLLALSFEVRRGERSAVENRDDVSAALFAEVRGVAGRILEQLRALAHGIHPTILTNSGLEPALASYVGSLDSPPSLSVELPSRLPPACEASAYAIVTAMIAAAPEGSLMSCAIREEGDDSDSRRPGLRRSRPRPRSPQRRRRPVPEATRPGPSSCCHARDRRRRLDAHADGHRHRPARGGLRRGRRGTRRSGSDGRRARRIDPTWPSSTSGCRRRSRTRDSSPHWKSKRTRRRRLRLSCRSTSSRTTRCA